MDPILFVDESAFVGENVSDNYIVEYPKLVSTRGLQISTDISDIQSDDTKICVVMVGLPARGKSLIAGKSKFAAPLTRVSFHLVPHQPYRDDR